MSSIRPNIGDIWLRKSDRGTHPIRVRVTGFSGHLVSWELEKAKWGARKSGHARIATWRSNYVFVRGGDAA